MANAVGSPDSTGLADRKVMAHVVSALRNKPSHLLLFGVCLILASLAGEAQFLVPASRAIYLFGVAGVLIVVALIVGAMVLRTPLETAVPTKIAATAIPGREIVVNIKDPKLEKIVCDTVKYTQKAVRFENRVFRDELVHSFDAFRDATKDWSRGQLSARHERYNQVLLTLYEQATSTVFSTTIPEYLSAWSSPLGDRMLRAHAVSKASVTRVFVFNKRSELTDDAIQLMKRQREFGVRVLVYFDDEDPAFDFPADVSRDFTIVDEGAAIGITVSYGGEDLRAIWNFGDEDKKGRFDSMRASLVAGSSDLEQILSWWAKQTPPPRVDAS